MEKLNRLGWAAGFSLAAYGVRVGIRATNPQILDSVVERLPFGWKPAAGPLVDRLYSIVVPRSGAGPGVRGFHLLYGDHTRLARTADGQQMLETLESDLRLHVAEHARNRIFVHAGVVAWRGLAIVCPGRTFAGKSTLVAELVRAGAVYYSDEYAVLDARGRVHAFAQPVSLREPGTFQQKKHPIEFFGGAAGQGALPVGLVVLTTYRMGRRWRPRRISPGRAVLELLAHTVSTRREPRAALEALSNVVGRAPVIKSFRGEAREAAGPILEALCR